MRYTGDMPENKVFTEDDFETRYGERLTVYHSVSNMTVLLVIEKRDHLPAEIVFCEEGAFRKDIEKFLSGWTVTLRPRSTGERIIVDANHVDFLTHLARRLMIYNFPVLLRPIADIY